MSQNKRNNRRIPFSVSQNFLTNKKTIHRILNITSICKEDHVIEIGSGKGHITKELLKRSKKVTAYEIDPKWSKYLTDSIGDYENLCIIHQDFLKAELPSKEPYKIFSNIPFCITTNIIRKLTESNHPPNETWLVMQKGAAKRFMGKPNETIFSLTMKPFFDMEIKYYFSRQDFHPMPAVDTVLLYIKKKEHPDITFGCRNEFAYFIRHCMTYGIHSLLSKKQISIALRKSRLPMIQTSGTILYIQWLCLFRCYEQFGKSK